MHQQSRDHNYLIVTESNIYIIMISDRQSKKRMWNDKEVWVFNNNLLEYLKRGLNPPTSKLQQVVNLLDGQRTLPQVRARANNIIKKKQMLLL